MQDPVPTILGAHRPGEDTDWRKKRDKGLRGGQDQGAWGTGHGSIGRGTIGLVGSGRVSSHWPGRRAFQAEEQHELKQ